MALVHHSSPGPLSCDVPTVFDKPLNVSRIESQGASARPHFDRRKIGLALASGVLNYPRNADTQFFRYVFCSNQLAYGPSLDGGSRQLGSEISSVQILHDVPRTIGYMNSVYGNRRHKSKIPRRIPQFVSNGRR